MFEKLLFVTSNENKVREVETILGFPVKQVALDLDEIQEMDVEKVIEHKARQAYVQLKQPVLVEDVAFYIKAWNNFPGPFIKWLHGSMGYELLTKTVPKNNRGVEWLVVYGLFDGKRFKTFSGSIKGTMPFKPKGKLGWGFDVIVIPHGQQKTLAEMPVDFKLKNPKFSARRKALNKMNRYFKEHAQAK